MVYYTYSYLREDKTPYYVGKGKNNRAYRKHKHITIPPKNRIIFLKINLTEEEAFKHEKYMINILGRKDLGTGILLNRTDGGEGTSGFEPWNKGKADVYSGENNPMYGKIGKEHPAFGYKHTEKVKRQLSERQLGEKNHMYGRIGKNNPNYGSKRNEETKRKMSENRKGQKNHRYGKKSWHSGKSLMMWITNGIESKYVFKETEIVDGWWRGRTFDRMKNKSNK